MNHLITHDSSAAALQRSTQELIHPSSSSAPDPGHQSVSQSVRAGARSLLLAGCCWSCVRAEQRLHPASSSRPRGGRAPCRSRQIFASLYCIYVLPCHVSVLCATDSSRGLEPPAAASNSKATTTRVRYIEPGSGSGSRRASSGARSRAEATRSGRTNN